VSVVRESFSGQPSVLELSTHLTQNQKDVAYIEGLTGSSRALALSCVVTEGIHVVVLPGREEALWFAHDLEVSTDPDLVFFYPTSAKKKINKYSDSSAQVQRTAALSAVTLRSAGAAPIFITTYPEAMAQRVAKKKALTNNSVRINVGDKLSHDFIKEQLLFMMFERVEFVTEPGQFAVRGGIIDLFSYNENMAYRIDFFGDQVEEIRVFDCNTQRSIEKRTEVMLVSNVQEVGEEEDGVSLLEFLEGEATLWIDTPIQKEALDYKGVTEHLVRCRRCYFSPLPGSERPNITVTFHTEPQPLFHKNFELLAQEMINRRSQGYTLFMLSESPSQIDRFREIFASVGRSVIDFTPQPALLNQGFIDHVARICVFTDHQIFDRYHRVKARRSVERSERITVQELSGFTIGDYIVHIDHGVGVFGGLVRTEINGMPQEVVKLIYKNNDVLFVNIHGLHRISRYKSKDAQPPKIYQLGTGTWQKLKLQTKKRVKDIARDLILLYAKRQSSQGFAFDPDGYLQHELESSFIYEDTPDQLKATQAVKQDMEKSYPMDRLICGDVGFGKTEVAIRAAFKAAAAGKQTAVLVPTTILALQHWNTFKERLRQTPVTVDFVCRLRSANEVKKTLERVKEGKVDILIGTHRILNNDVIFKDLGLLIVDEEQKFGVSAKERLRQLRLHVDTLTLTATPIPRTLQFSLMGARDLSIINTPPPNRIPVHTELQLFDEELIKNAVNYEVERGGQLFFVHNRVEDIYAVEEMIRRICPDVRTCVGHGQMEPKELERVILDFMGGGYDLLVCTTIIENGIDIPNANTMIINHAQNFGLSDLHQLRGRVGRSNRRAFCYLLAPRGLVMTDEARRRLRAIEAFSELGSGFNIAMQDLDIRGAGNLLGGEQSGFMAEIGFETYQRILEEAFREIREEQGEEGPELGAAGVLQRVVGEEYISDCVVDTDLEVLIPDDYVSQTAEKIRLYKEVNSIKEEGPLQQFLDELKDRFGPVPPEVLQLVYVVRLRRLAISLGFEKIVLKNGMMIVYFIFNQLSPYYRSPLFAKMLQHIQKQPAYRVKEQNNKLFVTIPGVTSVEQAYTQMINMRPNEEKSYH
jgi:transcription-repair coupling factor (superfamily II helicase)